MGRIYSFAIRNKDKFINMQEVPGVQIPLKKNKVSLHM